MNIEELKQKVIFELAGCKGRASLFMEIDGQVIEFNSNEIYQSASLIKLPILYEALTQIEAGTIMSDEQLLVTEEDKIGTTGILQSLPGVKSYSLQDLLTLMVIVSDNSATNILIDWLGIDSINKRIKVLKMQETILQRKMLDFTSVQLGRDNFTTPADIVACLKAGIEGEELTEESRNTFYSILQQQQFKEKLPAYMNEDTLTIGNKTGELPGVEHDCAVISNGMSRIFIAVLIDRLKNPELGKSTIREIGRHLNAYITNDSITSY